MLIAMVRAEAMCYGDEYFLFCSFFLLNSPRLVLKHRAVFELLCLRLSFFRMYICLFLSAFCTIFLPASVYKQLEKLVSSLFESF